MKVKHISCNTGTRALPDMSALALGHCADISGNALVPVLQLYIARYYTSIRHDKNDFNNYWHRTGWILVIILCGIAFSRGALILKAITPLHEK